MAFAPSVLLKGREESVYMCMDVNESTYREGGRRGEGGREEGREGGREGGR